MMLALPEDLAIAAREQAREAAAHLNEPDAIYRYPPTTQDHDAAALAATIEAAASLAALGDRRLTQDHEIRRLYAQVYRDATIEILGADEEI